MIYINYAYLITEKIIGFILLFSDGQLSQLQLSIMVRAIAFLILACINPFLDININPNIMEKLLEVTEIELHHIATILKLVIEGIAISIVAFSILKTVPKFVRSYQRKDSENWLYRTHHAEFWSKAYLSRDLEKNIQLQQIA